MTSVCNFSNATELNRSDWGREINYDSLKGLYAAHIQLQTNNATVRMTLFAKFKTPCCSLCFLKVVTCLFISLQGEVYHYQGFLLGLVSPIGGLWRFNHTNV